MKYTSLHDIATKKVRSKKRFYKHLAVFISAMFLMISINLYSYRNLWYYGFWAIYPLVSWGSMILLQYLLVFGFPVSGALSEEWEIKQVKKELNKLDDSNLHQDGYADLTMEERLELKELDRLKSKWDSDQYV